MAASAPHSPGLRTLRKLPHGLCYLRPQSERHRGRVRLRLHPRSQQSLLPRLRLGGSCARLLHRTFGVYVASRNRPDPLPLPNHPNRELLRKPGPELCHLGSQAQQKRRRRLGSPRSERGLHPRLHQPGKRSGRHCRARRDRPGLDGLQSHDLEPRMGLLALNRRRIDLQASPRYRSSRRLGKPHLRARRPHLDSSFDNEHHQHRDDHQHEPGLRSLQQHRVGLNAGHPRHSGPRRYQGRLLCRRRLPLLVRHRPQSGGWVCRGRDPLGFGPRPYGLRSRGKSGVDLLGDELLGKPRAPRPRRVAHLHLLRHPHQACPCRCLLDSQHRLCGHDHRGRSSHQQLWQRLSAHLGRSLAFPHEDPGLRYGNPRHRPRLPPRRRQSGRPGCGHRDLERDGAGPHLLRTGSKLVRLELPALRRLQPHPPLTRRCRRGRKPEFRRTG